MFSTRPLGGSSPLGTLQRLAKRQTAQDQCEFCSTPLGPVHRHLLELASRTILCTCDPCGLRFDGVVGGRYKLVPRQGRTLAGFQMTDEQWASLGLPIDLAFIFLSSLRQKPVGLYPSPGGVIESLLSPESWRTLVEANSVLQHLEPDTEALLINRTAGARDYYVVPIDICFELAGLVRVHWRGLAGGTAVWKEISGFFERLRSTLAPHRIGQTGEAKHA